MLALIQREIVEHGWLTLEEFVDIVAIAEMTPGPSRSMLPPLWAFVPQVSWAE